MTVHWYGILVATGFLAGLWTAARRARKVGISPETIYDFGPWIIIGGIIGARILYVVSYWNEDFAGQPFYEVFMIQHGGLVFYGGLVGSILSGWAYLNWKQLPVWKIADIIAPSICIGYFFGRFGCLMNGCCYGRICNMPWGITYPATTEPHSVPTGIPLHPTQIYDSLLNAAFYVFLVWLFPRRKFDGQIFAAYLIGYSLLRSFVEYFRGDYPVHYIGGIATPAQLVSVGILAVGLLLMFLLPRTPAQPAVAK